MEASEKLKSADEKMTSRGHLQDELEGDDVSGSDDDMLMTSSYE